MKKAAMILVMSSLFCFSGLTTASAVVLVDAGTPAGIGATAIYNNQFAAQEFTLLAGATITQIAPFMSKEATATLNPVVKVQLTDAIGPGTPLSALIAEFSLAVSNPTGAFLSIPTSFLLPAGTFFLVYSSTAAQDSGARLWATAPTDIGDDFAVFGFPPGNLNSTFPPASNWGLQTGLSANYGVRISGDPVPEPGTLLLLGSGLAALAGYGWRCGRRGKGVWLWRREISGRARRSGRGFL